MAMKYGNAQRISAAVALVIALAGCAHTGSQDDWLSAPAASATLMITDDFLPEAQRGDDGQWLAYEPRANPYANQRGRINRNAVERFIEARRALDAEQWDRAETVLTQLVEAEPSLSGPRVLLGDIALGRADLELAHDFYVQAIRVNSDNVNAYLRLAYVQRRQGEFLQAQNTYARLLALWPDFPEAHLNLAVLYDLYLNHPIRAQRHMEAFQFLTGERDDQVRQWLAEIRGRTGIPARYPAHGIEGAQSALSYSEAER
jgi:tetratricopeptide (TPR) repeat protein